MVINDEMMRVARDVVFGLVVTEDGAPVLVFNEGTRRMTLAPPVELKVDLDALSPWLRAQQSSTRAAAPKQTFPTVLPLLLRRSLPLSSSVGNAPLRLVVQVCGRELCVGRPFYCGAKQSKSAEPRGRVRVKRCSLEPLVEEETLARMHDVLQSAADVIADVDCGNFTGTVVPRTAAAPVEDTEDVPPPAATPSAERSKVAKKPAKKEVAAATPSDKASQPASGATQSAAHAKHRRRPGLPTDEEVVAAAVAVAAADTARPPAATPSAEPCQSTAKKAKKAGSRGAAASVRKVVRFPVADAGSSIVEDDVEAAPTAAPARATAPPAPPAARPARSPTVEVVLAPSASDAAPKVPPVAGERSAGAVDVPAATTNETIWRERSTAPSGVARTDRAPRTLPSPPAPPVSTSVRAPKHSIASETPPRKRAATGAGVMVSVTATPQLSTPALQSPLATLAAVVTGWAASGYTLPSDRSPWVAMMSAAQQSRECGGPAKGRRRGSSGGAAAARGVNATPDTPQPTQTLPVVGGWPCETYSNCLDLCPGTTATAAGAWLPSPGIQSLRSCEDDAEWV